MRRELGRLLPWVAHDGATWSARSAARRQIALLVLLPIAGMSLLGLVLAWIADPVATGGIRLALSMVAVGGMLTGAELARRGRVSLGVFVALAAIESVIWTMMTGRPADHEAVLPYLAVPILVGGLTLRPSLAVAATALTLASIPVLDWLIAGHAVDPAHLLHLDDMVRFGLLGVLAIVASVVQEHSLRTAEERAHALEAATLALRKSGAERIRLLQQIAHDLGHPLTPVRLQLALMERRGPDEQAAEALRVMRRNVDHLVRLVGDIQELALMEGQGVKVASAPLDLAGLVRQAVASMHPAAEARGIRLGSTGPERLTVRGDAGRLTQVLYNLIGNALKFTPAGGIVAVGLHEEPGHAHVAVRDSGAGMRPDQVQRLFRPFSQVHDAGTLLPEADRGTGLGLVISKGIVEAHGGQIRAESAGPGQGSTFTFLLPLAGPP